MHEDVAPVLTAAPRRRGSGAEGVAAWRLLARKCSVAPRHLAGVLDWERARLGPAGYDVGYYRLDLRALTDPTAWLPAWHAVGMTHLTAEIVRDRLDHFIIGAVSRANHAPQAQC